MTLREQAWKSIALLGTLKKVPCFLHVWHHKADGRIRYILALVSADATRNLKAQKEYLEEEGIDCRIDFELIGRESIFGISRYAIPENA